MLEDKTANNVQKRFYRTIFADSESQKTEMVVPEGTIEITESGTYDVSEYATAEVNTGSSLNLIQVNIINNLGTTIQGSSFDYEGVYRIKAGPSVVYVPITDGNTLDATIGVFTTGRKLTTISATATDDKSNTIRCFVGQFDFSNANVFTVGLHKVGTYNGTEITVTLSGS